MIVDLSKTSRRGYRPGRSFAYRALWLIVEALVMLNPVVTPYGLKRWVLRRFGAKVGRGVLIKPNVHVKYPWHLEVGDNVWIGERAWIDNFVSVRIAANAVVSQGAWVGAFARIGPGVTGGANAIVTLGSVLLKDAQPNGIYTGNPAMLVGERTIRDQPGPAAGAPS